MCGICGYYNREKDFSPEIIPMMAQTLWRRGPDGQGVFVDENAKLALGQTRLAIIDPSPTGAQPMTSGDGRFVIVYNGEIYNADELRKLAEDKAGPIAWRGYSDTEAFLEAMAACGVKEAMDASIGMFAFALWDKEERKLVLGRDRFGVKPLYWSIQNNTFMFSSELKALAKHPLYKPHLSLSHLAAFFRHNYLPDPFTPYEEVFTLKPGHMLTVNSCHEIQLTQWYDPLQVALAGVADRVTNHRAALNELERLLRDSVKRRIYADVPVGCFLSGGIDSSLVSALMADQVEQKIKTFSIGFQEKYFDESVWAKEIAKVIGSEHYEYSVTGKDALAIIDKMPEVYDALMADSSQLPTFFLSQLAKTEVTVALSGDGGDEFFGGYLQHNNNVVPKKLPAFINRAEFYQRRYNIFWLGYKLLRDVKFPEGIIRKDLKNDLFADDAEVTQFIDTVFYLPADILVKVDRDSMWHSLEVRTPLLDHRIFALAWRMPPDLRRALGKGKWPLRHLLDRYIPPKLTERPKQGFSIPMLSWLKGDWRDWGEDMLSQIRQDKILNYDVVLEIWQKTLAGKIYSEWIWGVFMFQLWHNRWKNTYSI